MLCRGSGYRPAADAQGHPERYGRGGHACQEAVALWSLPRDEGAIDERPLNGTVVRGEEREVRWRARLPNQWLTPDEHTEPRAGADALTRAAQP